MTVLNPFFPMEEDNLLPNHEDESSSSIHETPTMKNLTRTPPISKILHFLTSFIPPFLLIIILLSMLPNSTWFKNTKANHNPQFHIESFRPFSFDISSSKLSAKWKIIFSTKNPSNVTTYFYDNLEASIYYGKTLLALTMVEPFYLQPRDKTYVRALFGYFEVILEDWAATAILRYQKLWGPLTFHAKIRSRVKVDPGKTSEEIFSLKVLCEDVIVMFDDSWWKSGLMQGGPKRCKEVWKVDIE